MDDEVGCLIGIYSLILIVVGFGVGQCTAEHEEIDKVEYANEIINDKTFKIDTVTTILHNDTTVNYKFVKTEKDKSQEQTEKNDTSVITEGNKTTITITTIEKKCSKDE